MLGRQKSNVEKSNSDYYGLSYIVMERPGYTKILNTQSDTTSQESYNYHILYAFAHAYEMKKMNKLSDSEWENWLQLIKSTFQSQSTAALWRKDPDLKKWFDPQFYSFITNEIMSAAITI
jgi:hypothetical protein